MLYFRGCTARERVNSISNSTEKLLKLANVDFKTLDNEECCGSVLLRTGFEEEAKEQMKKNLSKFKDEEILVSCAGCYKTLKHDYADLLGAELNVIHISQLLKSLINENKLHDNTDSSNFDETVTYHDPCHLGRHSNEFDAPRDVIKNFSNLKEMDNIRESSKCCGSGGGVKSAFPEIAKSIAIERGKEAESTGCDILVTSCPFCKLNLSENSNLDVLDLSEFVLNKLQKETINNRKNNNKNKDGRSV